jgi:hypothetical protein
MLVIAADMLLVGYGVACANGCTPPGTALVGIVIMPPGTTLVACGIMLGDAMGDGEKARAIGAGENGCGKDCCTNGCNLGCCNV